jgi:hypothetical protein
LKSTNVIAFDVGAGAAGFPWAALTATGLPRSRIHHFFNKPVRVLDSLHWNMLRIFQG